jgi:hypothetical protein
LHSRFPAEENKTFCRKVSLLSQCSKSQLTTSHHQMNGEGELKVLKKHFNEIVYEDGQKKSDSMNEKSSCR